MKAEGLVWLTALLATATAQAADVSSELAGCRSKSDDEARLACYDQLADKAAPPTARANNTPAAPAASAKKESTPVAPPASASAATTPHEDFGYRGGPLARADAVARAGAERNETDEAEHVEATVTEVSRKAPRGILVVTLDNGQTWAQKAPDARFLVQAGDRVRIEAAALRSYMMFRTDSKRGTRVTRVR